MKDITYFNQIPLWLNINGKISNTKLCIELKNAHEHHIVDVTILFFPTITTSFLEMDFQKDTDNRYDCFHV